MIYIISHIGRERVERLSLLSFIPGVLTITLIKNRHTVLLRGYVVAPTKVRIKIPLGLPEMLTFGDFCGCGLGRECLSRLFSGVHVFFFASGLLLHYH